MTAPDPYQMRIADLCLAARGDVEAQLRLAQESRRAVVSGEADDITTSIDGVNYARLAASQGNADALFVLVEHCAHLAKTYAECGDIDCSDDWHGQAIGLLEIISENLPAENGEALALSLNQLVADANPSAMRHASFYRNLWVPVFGTAAFA